MFSFVVLCATMEMPPWDCNSLWYYFKKLIAKIAEALTYLPKKNRSTGTTYDITCYL